MDKSEEQRKGVTSVREKEEVRRGCFRRIQGDNGYSWAECGSFSLAGL